MNNKGVTLTELLIVIVVMGIIAGISSIVLTNLIEDTRLKADEQTVIALNDATTYYINYTNKTELFEEDLTASERIEILYAAGFIDSKVEPQTKDASFQFDKDSINWQLYVEDASVPLSPYGDTFEEISPNIIVDIQEFYAEKDRYGRTWGDYRYTDIGLEPTDWKEPIMHIYYYPGGSRLSIRPEDGYQFVLMDIYGEERIMKASYNWNITYDDTTKQWYYHRVLEENIVDISTLIVELS